MTDTIDISLPGEHVRKIGGNQAWSEMLALANAKAGEMGKQLASQEYRDVTVLGNTASDKYVATFKLR